MKAFIHLPILLTALLLFSNCSSDKKNESPSLSEAQLEEYQLKGSELAGATQKVLAGNLIPAVQEHGTLYALDFCNIKAHPLTDSMAVELQASIKRVSDHPRNPDNIANESELEFITGAKIELSNSGKASSAILQKGDRVVGYYPIVTNQLCMQCHGDPDSQISGETLAKIQELYPEDKATGYSEGELRGIWVVEMAIQEE